MRFLICVDIEIVHAFERKSLTQLHRLSKIGKESSDSSNDEENPNENAKENENERAWKDLSPDKCELAVTGAAFEYFAEMHKEGKDIHFDFPFIIRYAKIYARMSPDDKAVLVSHLQSSTGQIIGMCGDGANDCKALKTADIGLSLSEAEASIAAPFTSKIPDISPIIKLLREGRTSLVTSFQVFKFMALYSMIQYSSVIILYHKASGLGDYQFLYIDMGLIIPLSFSMARTGAYYKLDKALPTANLMSFIVLSSVIAHIALVFSFQLISYFVLVKQPWYEEFKPKKGARGTSENILSYGNTAIFLTSLFQYIMIVSVFSIGKPFRKSMFSNYTLCICFAILIAINLIIIFSPGSLLMSVFELKNIPTEFKVFIIGVCFVNWIVSYFTEKLIPVLNAKIHN